MTVGQTYLAIQRDAADAPGLRRGPVRQTEGLIGSVTGLLGLTLRAPEDTTLSRRAATLKVPRSTSGSTDAGGNAALFGGASG